MTIDEAIKVNEIMLDEAERRGLPHRVKALRLDNEALKCEQRNRRGLAAHDIEYLPGETEEGG